MDYHASTPVSEMRAPPLITPVIYKKYNTSPAGSTTGATQVHAYSKHASDTLYQESDQTTTRYDDITQQSDMDSITTPYQTHQLNSDRRNGSYPSSQTSHHSSDMNTRQYSSSAQHSPLYRDTCTEHAQEKYQGYNGSSADRHLTGSSGDNTVFIDSSEQKTPNEHLQDRYFKEGMFTSPCWGVYVI